MGYTVRPYPRQKKMRVWGQGDPRWRAGKAWGSVPCAVGQIGQ